MLDDLRVQALADRGDHPVRILDCRCVEYRDGSTIPCDEHGRHIPGDPAYVYGLRLAQGVPEEAAAAEARATLEQVAERIRTARQEEVAG